MSFVHKSTRIAVLSSPSQKDSIIPFALRKASAVLSDAFQVICSGIRLLSSDTSMVIVEIIGIQFGLLAKVMDRQYRTWVHSKALVTLRGIFVYRLTLLLLSHVQSGRHGIQYDQKSFDHA